MKIQQTKLMLCTGAALLVAGSVQADLLAGYSNGVKTWDTTEPANNVAADITATVFYSGADWGIQQQGSNDGDYGSYTGLPSPVYDGIGNAIIRASTANADGAFADFTITNTGVGDYELATFHFDVWRSYNDGAQFSAEVLAGGGITAGDLGAPTLVPNFAVPAGGGDDYADVDLSLAGLADNILAAGESVTFRIQRGAGAQLFLDNIGVTAIPEPSTLGLMGIASVVCLGVRRFRM